MALLLKTARPAPVHTLLPTAELPTLAAAGGHLMWSLASTAGAPHNASVFMAPSCHVAGVEGEEDPPGSTGSTGARGSSTRPITGLLAMDTAGWAGLQGQADYEVLLARSFPGLPAAAAAEVRHCCYFCCLANCRAPFVLEHLSSALLSFLPTHSGPRLLHPNLSPDNGAAGGRPPATNNTHSALCCIVRLSTPAAPLPYCLQIAEQLAVGPLHPTGHRVLCSSLHGPSMVLVGSAAHATSPVIGNGLSTSVEDAWLLNQVGLTHLLDTSIAATTETRRLRGGIELPSKLLLSVLSYCFGRTATNIVRSPGGAPPYLPASRVPALCFGQGSRAASSVGILMYPGPSKCLAVVCRSTHRSRLPPPASKRHQHMPVGMTN